MAIKGKSFASNVTITAQDSSHPPVFNTIKMVGSSNIVFDSISVDFHPTTATKDWTPAFQATSSQKERPTNVNAIVVTDGIPLSTIAYLRIPKTTLDLLLG